MKNIFFMGTIILMTITNGYSQCACCAGAGTGSSNGDYNNGILTLQKNKWVLETYSDYRTINQSNIAVAEEELEEETPLQNMFIQTLGARYGITNQITLSALVPYVFLHTDTGNDSGLGDLTLMGTFSLLRNNSFNLALQAGVELPTGIQKSAAFDNTTVVVGSGSYDPMVGIVFSKHWGKLTLQGNTLYKHTTNGFHGNYYGSISIHNLTLNYNIFGNKNSCDNTTFDQPRESNDLKTTNDSGKIDWSVFGGYYGEWLDKLEEDGITDENSGFYLGYAALGNNIGYGSWSFPLTVSLPIIQNMNGDQNNGGFRIRLGIIKSF